MSEMIYGIHAVQALLERAPERFQEVYILKGREDKRLLPLIHALEAQGVVIQRSAQLNATAKKVACGAAENVPLIRVTNLARTMRLLQEENVWIVGTAGEADHTLFQSKMTGPMALVMGAEGEGMRRLTREHCDELISIPMAGSVSSLNVSVATGICLFEAVRQRS